MSTSSGINKSKCPTCPGICSLHNNLSPTKTPTKMYHCTMPVPDGTVCGDQFPGSETHLMEHIKLRHITMTMNTEDSTRTVNSVGSADMTSGTTTCTTSQQSRSDGEISSAVSKSKDSEHACGHAHNSNKQWNRNGNKSDFTLTDVQGDLFASQLPGSFCHSVSRDMEMKKGIATKFKQVFEKLKNVDLKNSAWVKGVGGMVVLQEEDYFVYNLITKNNYHESPISYNNLERCLRKMRNHARAHGVTRINMPKISCGRDGLKWNVVKKMIHNSILTPPGTR